MEKRKNTEKESIIKKLRKLEQKTNLYQQTIEQHKDIER